MERELVFFTYILKKLTQLPFGLIIYLKIESLNLSELREPEKKREKKESLFFFPEFSPQNMKEKPRWKFDIREFNKKEVWLQPCFPSQISHSTKQNPNKTHKELNLTFSATQRTKLFSLTVSFSLPRKQKETKKTKPKLTLKTLIIQLVGVLDHKIWG